MWSEGVFGLGVDSIFLACAAVLCLAVAWRRGRRLGPPRFPGARAMLWAVAVIGLPIPLYFACGAGLWLGAMSNTSVGAMMGWVLLPPLMCSGALSVLAVVFTRPVDPERLHWRPKVGQRDR